MRSAVDVIGRCRRAMSVSVPAKLDRGERESVPFPCPSRLRPGYCFISLFSLQVQGKVVWCGVVCTLPPAVLGPKCFAVSMQRLADVC